MRSEDEIKQKLDWSQRSFDGWREPNGWLVPTEPDADERARVRASLIIHIETLQWVLGEEPWR